MRPIIAPGGTPRPKRSGGWASSTRRADLPKDWPRIQARILRRDNYRCRWPLPYGGGECGAEAHEVDHREDRDTHDDDALWSLCSRHHGRKTQREAAAGRKARGR